VQLLAPLLLLNDIRVTNVNWASAAAVDEGVDGGGVVNKVLGEVLDGRGVAVVDNALTEVPGDGGGLVVGHAWSLIIARLLLATDDVDGAGNGSNGEQAGGEGEGTHFGGISCLLLLKGVEAKM
jgi:hypothetical protein